jgi:membrane-bound ClpP family serine protease
MIEEERKIPELRGHNFSIITKIELIFILLIVAMYALIFSSLRLSYRINHIP